jgi:hypothetical protein
MRKNKYTCLQAFINAHREKQKKTHEKFSKLFFEYGNKIAILFTQQFVCKSVEMMLG